MTHGHVTGHKRERRNAQAWYAAIEAETLRQLEADAAQSKSPTTETESAMDILLSAEEDKWSDGNPADYGDST